MKKLFIFHSLLVVSGMLFGVIAFFCLPEAQITQLQQYLTAQMQNFAAAATLSETAGRIFRANFMDYMRVYLAGICLLGVPLLVLFLFLKGFTLGFIVCFLMGHSPLLVLTRLLYFPLLIVAATYSSKFAFILIQNRVGSPVRQLVQYTITFGLLLILVFILSYLDGLSCYGYLRNLL